MQHIVEFFGIPRERVGLAEATLVGDDVGAVLAEIEVRFPRLKPLLDHDRISPHYLLSLNGRRFLTSLDEPLAAGSRLLLLSADAGG